MRFFVDPHSQVSNIRREKDGEVGYGGHHCIHNNLWNDAERETIKKIERCNKIRSFCFCGKSIITIVISLGYFSAFAKRL